MLFYPVEPKHPQGGLLFVREADREWGFLPPLYSWLPTHPHPTNTPNIIFPVAKDKKKPQIVS